MHGHQVACVRNIRTGLPAGASSQQLAFKRGVLAFWAVPPGGRGPAVLARALLRRSWFLARLALVRVAAWAQACIPGAVVPFERDLPKETRTRCWLGAFLDQFRRALRPSDFHALAESWQGAG